MKLSLWTTVVILLSSSAYAASPESTPPPPRLPLDNTTQDREHQCLKVFWDGDFCSCINSTLAKGISFQDYVNVLITPKDVLNYEGLSPENKKVVDSILRTREQCF